MAKKRKAGTKRGRREFLKALPSAGAAFKWTADKLGGALLTGAAAWMLKVFSARSRVPVRGNTVIVVPTGRLTFVGQEVIVREGPKIA